LKSAEELLTFLLAAMAMNEAQRKNIQRAYLQETLGKIGILNSTTLITNGMLCTDNLWRRSSSWAFILLFETEQLLPLLVKATRRAILLQHGSDKNSITQKTAISNFKILS
jgi:hypothetical protein